MVSGVTRKTPGAGRSLFEGTRGQVAATLRELRRVRPRHLGFAFFWSWMWMFMHFGQVFGAANLGGAATGQLGELGGAAGQLAELGELGVVTAGQLPLLILTISSALTMLAAGTVVPQRFAPLTARPVVHVSAIVFVVAGTLLHAFGGEISVGGVVGDAVGAGGVAGAGGAVGAGGTGGGVAGAVGAGGALVVNVATVIAPALAGIGMVHHMLIWGEFYGSVGSQRAAIYMTLTILCAVALTAAVRLLPSEIGLLTVCLYPVFSSLLVRRNSAEIQRHQSRVLAAHDGGERGSERPEREPGAERPERPTPRYLLPLPWKICVAAGSYGMVSSLVSSSTVFLEVTSRLPHGDLSQLADILVALLLLLGVLFFGRNLDRGFTYRPTLLVMVVGCGLLPFIETMQGAVAVGIVSGGYMYFYALSWILYADATYRLRLTAFRVFAWGRVFGALGYAVGMLINFVLVSFGQASILRPDVLSGITMLLLIATSIFVLDERNVASGWGRTAKNADISGAQEKDYKGGEEVRYALESETVPGATAPELTADNRNRESLLEQSCALLSESCSLTRREREIFNYLARGRSLAWIEKTLHVSYSTVNTHVANIYHKLDVHSRQELLDLVENPTPALTRP